MDKLIHNKQILDLIAEYAKTADSSITSSDIKKEFINESDENSNIIAIGHFEEKPVSGLLNNDFASLLKSVKLLINTIEKKEAILQEQDKAFLFLKNDINQKIESVLHQLSEISKEYKGEKKSPIQSADFKEFQIKQQENTENIKLEIEKTNLLFTEFQTRTASEKKGFSENIFKLLDKQFTHSDQKLIAIEHKISKIGWAENFPKNNIIVPKWLLYLNLFLSGLCLLLFILLLRKNSIQDELILINKENIHSVFETKTEPTIPKNESIIQNDSIKLIQKNTLYDVKVEKDLPVNNSQKKNSSTDNPVKNTNSSLNNLGANKKNTLQTSEIKKSSTVNKKEINRDVIFATD